MTDSARTNTLIKGAAILSVDNEIGVLPAGDIRIHDGVIVEVADNLTPFGEEVIDGSKTIVMPGLIDSHCHVWSSVGKNFISDERGYFPAKWATSAHYTAEDFSASVLLASYEAIAAGITTLHNWDHNTRSEKHALAQLDAHRSSGIRVRYSYGHADMYPVDQVLDFSQIDRVGAEWPFIPEGLISLGVNLRGPDLGQERVFHLEMEQARARRLPVSIHTMQGAETLVDAESLEKRGYLGPDFLICHFLAARDADITAMVRSGSALSYSVHSELRLGESGDPRTALLRFVRAGATVSLSTDATSISPVDLFEAMRLVWNFGIPWKGVDEVEYKAIEAIDVIKMGTINGARALGIDRITGSITPGKRADLIMIDAQAPNVAPLVDIESTVVRSVRPENVSLVMVDGQILKRDGVVTRLDRDEVVRKALSAAESVGRRSGLIAGE